MSRSFDGTSGNHLNVETPVVTAPPFSMFAWYYSTSASGNQTLISIGGQNAAFTEARGFALTIGFSAGSGENSVVAESRQHNTRPKAKTSVAPTANVWQNGCGVWAGIADRRAFLNGGSKGTNATSQAVTAADLKRTAVGLTRELGNFSGMVGQIAHPAIWNVALTDDEVAMLAAGISPLRVRPEALVMYLPYLGRDGPEIDIINARTLTVTGATASSNEAPLIWPRARRRAFRAPEPISLEIDHGALTVAGQGATFVANQTVESNGQLQLSGGTASAESELATSGASLTIGGTELDLAISAPVPDTGTSAVRGGGRASRSRRYWVEINGQIVYVNTPAEAQQLFQQFEEQAPREAERQADELVARRTASVRSLGQVKPVRLAPPTLRTNLPESEALREARALLGNLYQDAARRATAALEAERRRWLQDQDDAQTLIALGDL